ncbi:MAG TPA: FAD-dependent oxidoreductase [Dehalococcoidia bacterium]|nr:FAD-dependent oxidoreductase [Dehalococcoidia bacterium]
MDRERLVVIGGVAAGMSAASRAKRNKSDMEVIVLERGGFVSYGSCGLPYFISDMIEDVQGLVVHDAAFFKDKRGIDVLIRHEVTKIDPQVKVVFARNLEQDEEIELSYDKLAICTGASPYYPDLPGIDLKNIFVIRTAEDGVVLKSSIGEATPKKVAIIGAGLIGLEMAEAFKAIGLEVTVIKRPGSILKMFDDDMVKLVEEELKAKGVDLVKDAVIQGFEGDTQGKVTAVVLAQGTYEADLVLLAIGSKPNSDLARQAGLEVAANGTIVVSERMQTSNPDIFAAGDCVGQKHLITGKDVYIPRGTTANKQGRVAGDNASGGNEVFKGVLGTAVSKIFDLTVARTGLSSAEASAEGYDFVTSTVAHPSHAHTYLNPEPEDITIKLIIERTTGKLLGAQMIGRIGVAKRIDVFAAALHNDMTVEEISGLDLSYSPPFAPVWDSILVAANVALRKLEG